MIEQTQLTHLVFPFKGESVSIRMDEVFCVDAKNGVTIALFPKKKDAQRYSTFLNTLDEGAETTVKAQFAVIDGKSIQTLAIRNEMYD